jgi:hypothetical protein
MPQFGASLADDSRVIFYNHNMFVVQATARYLKQTTFRLHLVEKKIGGTKTDLGSSGASPIKHFLP